MNFGIAEIAAGLVLGLLGSLVNGWLLARMIASGDGAAQRVSPAPILAGYLVRLAIDAAVLSTVYLFWGASGPLVAAATGLLLGAFGMTVHEGRKKGLFERRGSRRNGA